MYIYYILQYYIYIYIYTEMYLKHKYTGLLLYGGGI